MHFGTLNSRSDKRDLPLKSDQCRQPLLQHLDRASGGRGGKHVSQIDADAR